MTWKKIHRNCDVCGLDYEANVRVCGSDEYIINSTCGQVCREKRMQEYQKNRALQELPLEIPKVFEKWNSECGNLGKFWTASFENFDHKLQPKAYKVMRGYNGDSIVLLSPDLYGVGKTHLAAALVNHLLATAEKAMITAYFEIHKHPCPVYFTTEPDLLSRIKQTYNTKDLEAENEKAIYDSLSRFDLLIIDDVGKTTTRDKSFLQSVYFKVINQRYNNELPIILTTNLSYSELEAHIGGACADRLREMCPKENFVKMTGVSYRGNRPQKGG
jgi:DNA replication protein DnaC